MNSTVALVMLSTLLAFGSLPQGAGQSNGIQGEASFRNDGQLVFIKPSTSATIKMINIEIADNDAERTQGLMWRRYMPEDDGMLFIFSTQEPLTFWMKNTYIPLDIIFADRNGKIVSIYQDATPLSEAPIPSGAPAKYAVEVNGGFCATYGINSGDKIVYER
jgi:hypothetical protein